MNNINISLIQSDIIWEDVEQNLLRFNEKIDSIKEHSDIIVLPEMFNTAFSMTPEKFRDNVKSLEWLRQKAKEKNSVIVGSMITNENDTFYNRLIWMMPDGSYQKYDKRHLFRLGKENLHYMPGNEILITELKGWKFRPLVCYDLRFPVWSKNRLSDKKNKTSDLRLTTYDCAFEYDCLIYVANWPSARKNAWRALLIARAIENQAYAIGVNRIGNDGNGLSHSGESVVVDYKGNIICESAADIEETLTVTLSMDDLYTYRKHFAFALDWDNFNIVP